jgi:hypothetical protein
MISLRLAAFGVAAAAVIAVAHFTPFIGYGAQLHRLSQARDGWRVAADNWKTASVGWEAAFRKSERLRKAEQRQAVAAVDAVQSQCDARVKQARASAKVIREIVNAPVKYDANNCPVRVTIPTDRLRDALQPR